MQINGYNVDIKNPKEALVACNQIPAMEFKSYDALMENKTLILTKVIRATNENLGLTSTSKPNNIARIHKAPKTR